MNINILGHQVTRQSFTLRALVNRLENAIITLSGPAIAISGIIAGIDLLTGGSMFKDTAWLSLTWAICLLLTLDFQVLVMGARARGVYRSSKGGGRKFTEILVIILIAAAISSVSVQMQSIIARTQATTTYTDRTGQHTRNLTIDEATRDMGINPVALIWERSALVLILIFMSGWFRDEERRQDDEATGQSQAPAALDYNQIAQAIAPLLAPQLAGLRATIIAEIRPLIVAPAPLDYQQLARQIAPLVAPETAPAPLDYRAIAGAIAPLLPEPEPVQALDYGAIAQHIAPLLKPQFLEARRYIIEEVKAAIPQFAAPAPAPQLEASATRNGTRATGQSQDQDTEESEAERDTRLEAAYQELRATSAGKRVSGRALADKAKANRAYCGQWLQEHHPENEAGYVKELLSDPQLYAAINELKSKPLSEPGHGATRNGTGATGQSHQDTEPVPAYVVDSGVLAGATH
jgi:hypothetical protein